MASDNTLQTLNDKLFAQLDRLDNRDLVGDSLKEELERTDAIIDIGKTIISNADLMLRAAVARDEKLGAYQGALPKVLQSGDSNGQKKNLHR